MLNRFSVFVLTIGSARFFLAMKPVSQPRPLAQISPGRLRQSSPSLLSGPCTVSLALGRCISRQPALKLKINSSLPWNASGIGRHSRAGPDSKRKSEIHTAVSCSAVQPTHLATSKAYTINRSRQPLSWLTKLNRSGTRSWMRLSAVTPLTGSS